MNIRRLARDGVLTAVALTIFIVELRLPSLTPIPGIKLGLANIVTLVAMFTLGPVDAAGILFCRLILGSLYAGSAMSLLYSAAGGTLAYLASLALRRVIRQNQLWVASVFAAVAHNAGQIAVAVLVTSTPSVALYYLPVLTVSGVVTGLLTGLAAQFTVKRIGRYLRS